MLSLEASPYLHIHGLGIFDENEGEGLLLIFSTGLLSMFLWEETYETKLYLMTNICAWLWMGPEKEL